MTQIEVTLKGGASYSDPWVKITGETPAEVGAILRGLAAEGAFTDVVTVAALFHNAPKAGVESVQAVIPGAEVVSDTKTEYPPTPAVDQSLPACEVCGKPTKFLEGVGATGPWAGWICQTGDKTHTKFVK